MRGVRLEPRALPANLTTILEATITDLAPFKEANVVHRAETADTILHPDIERTALGMVRTTALPPAVVESFATACLTSHSVLSAQRKVKDTRTVNTKGEKASSRANDPNDWQTRSSEMQVSCNQRISEDRYQRTKPSHDLCVPRVPQASEGAQTKMSGQGPGPRGPENTKDGVQHGATQAYCIVLNDYVAFAVLGDRVEDALQCMSAQLHAMTYQYPLETIEASFVQRVFLPRTNTYI